MNPESRFFPHLILIRKSEVLQDSMWDRHHPTRWNTNSSELMLAHAYALWMSTKGCMLISAETENMKGNLRGRTRGRQTGKETARKRSRVDEKVPRGRNTSSEVIWSWSGNRVQRPEGDNQEKKSKGSDKLFLAVCSRSIILHSQVSSKHLSLNGSPIIWALHSFNYPYAAFI